VVNQVYIDNLVNPGKEKFNEEQIFQITKYIKENLLNLRLIAIIIIILPNHWNFREHFNCFRLRLISYINYMVF